MSENAFHFELGGFQCVVFSDGTFSYPASSFFLDAPEDELAGALKRYGMPPDEVTIPWLCLFINTGTQWVLVDTGAGPGAMPGAGRLLQNMVAEGIDPRDIDVVIITHAHPDHIGGATDAEGKPAFPHARYVMYKDEWEFWTSDAGPARFPAGDELKQAMLTTARKSLPPLEDRLDLIDGEADILPGIRAVSAPGHTPGHMALRLSPEKSLLFHIGDAVLHPIHLEHPGWRPAFDFDAIQASTTRRQLLNHIADDGLLMFASHFPFPGLGHVDHDGNEWLWRPLEATR